MHQGGGHPGVQRKRRWRVEEAVATPGELPPREQRRGADVVEEAAVRQCGAGTDTPSKQGMYHPLSYSTTCVIGAYMSLCLGLLFLRGCQVVSSSSSEMTVCIVAHTTTNAHMS